ncbi:hypothetical protein FQA39_LY12376 [Lamprigera yunnana]|nr:hypothetical protein FQA39_LY12376 [Lamprigera yunnana]
MYYLDLLILRISVFILILSVLIGVAFLTLLERKILGYIQMRKGPNKVGFLAETSRTPFDFAEGESELVSRFNVEYRAGGFLLIFISEYVEKFLLLLFI